MKKVLILALVLGVVSMANAGLVTATLVADGLETVVDTNVQTIAFVGIASANGSPMSVTGLAINMQLSGEGRLFYIDDQLHPCLAPGFEPEYGKWIGYSFFDVNGKVGTLAVFGYTGSPTGVTIYDDYDWGTSEVAFRNGSIVSLSPIFFIPEPATLALLGLGGLFLRRK